MTKRVAIYARVSTDEGKQNPETQLRQLREYAKLRKFKISDEYIDFASGRSNQRTNYKRLFDAVRKRQVDVVLVWSYDRFARSTVELILAIDEFRNLDVDFISFQQNIDTTTPHGRLFFTIAAGFAEFESAQLASRVRAGMARAKAEGKRIHRPPIPPATQKQIATLRKQKFSIKQIGKRLGIGYATAHKYVRALEAH